MTAEEWQTIWLTTWVSALSVLLILPPGVAVAWLLARKEWPGKSLVETFVALPLVLPPVATGLILLKLLGRRGPIGGWLHESFHVDIVFTWKAVLIALGVMSFPLLVRSLRTAIEEVPVRLEGIARTLGASPWRVFWTITLPLARRGLAAGVVLAFARALGEFGATIMVAGFIQGETSTISLVIYQHVQTGHDHEAMKLLVVAVIMAFIALWISETLSRRRRAP
ncbi:molybdate transport system permease protein [Roseimicrobium gellanilyticum]|uniref:Molybdenum transport system permease n=1 Tax=Roseimicrobium gellanilyticum TaxID=748857 RepID=A0A366HVB1_9BACT|nr:molybdate ABC transporter permease subunit [Roseimicrobium gellanilyticum]RBP48037.1 molybdate transport system permease protein [Roseimicrobium gellanilyticum]